LDWWQEYRLDQNLMMAATPAQHFSGRGITDRNKALWASWVIKTPFHKIFFSGDSGYFGGFKEIGDKYGPFDMTFMECGAYGKSWPKVHMFPEQTVQLTYGLLRMQWETIQDLKDGLEEKVALCTQELENILNKVKSGSQSRLDRLHQHAKNINKLDNFSDDFTILEMAFG
jgi:L-ascorbate metabolism protein UlaG (beta-lactamase superfamily)